MAQVGDTVRFLSSTGGGVITRIDGKIAYVEEDGFETPVLIKELVVVLPAGHQPDPSGARLMFDQKAFDTGRASVSNPKSAETQAASKDTTPRPAPLPTVETAYGDKLSISLAFEPSDVKRLSESKFNAVLVNDSNYTLQFIFVGCKGDDSRWKIIYQGVVEPNELIDLATYSHSTLPEIERIAIQAIAYKEDKPFELRSPIDASRRLDLKKFYKTHCFRPGRYFDYPVLEFPLLTDGAKAKAANRPTEDMTDRADVQVSYDESIAKLKNKFGNKDKQQSKHPENPADNPNKLLPLIEVDLHINELVDTTAGMNNAAMLELQLDTVRKTMATHSRRIGQKIVFIHGKGEGVLRKAVLSLLKKEYPAATIQDASFREYGFGATLVTIHNDGRNPSTKN